MECIGHSQLRDLPENQKMLLLHEYSICCHIFNSSQFLLTLEVLKDFLRTLIGR